jgi:exopolyphosphatase/pppGpp-phosphohydrolase
LRNGVEEYYNQLAAIKIGMSYVLNGTVTSLARLHKTQWFIPIRKMHATWIPVRNN